MYKSDPIRDERKPAFVFEYKNGPYGVPVDRTTTTALPSRRYRYQHGWRGPRNVDNIDPGNPDAIPGGGSWGSAGGYANGISRLERATTPSPMVRDSSLPVHHRHLREFQMAPAVRTGGSFYQEPPYDRQFTEAWLGLGWKSDSPEVHVPQVLSEATLDFYGSRLSERMQATRPTRPDFSLARAVLELRDFPRLITHAASLRAGKAGVGDSYLSFQFGYAPLVADLKKCARAIINSDKAIRQFVRDSGRLVRRSANLADTTSNEVSYSSLTTTFVQYERSFFLELGSYRLETVESTTARAFALWEYFASDHNGAIAMHQSAVKRADHFLGLKLTPQVLWQVTPWTWMIDWFLNVSNLLGYQQEVADYSLAMRRSGYVVERSRRMTAVQEFRYRNGAGVRTPWMQAVCTSNSKIQIRRPGLSPYGLVKPWDGLNPFQISIAAALGLQRRGV